MFYWIYDRRFLDNLITFRIPLQSVSFPKWKTQVVLPWALMVYIFLGNFKNFWKYKCMVYMMSFKLWLQCSPIILEYFAVRFQFLYFDLLSGDCGTTILMFHLSFSLYWWDLIGRFIAGAAFNFKVFFPALKLNNETAFL